jgi:hypothetical protein
VDGEWMWVWMWVCKKGVGSRGIGIDMHGARGACLGEGVSKGKQECEDEYACPLGNIYMSVDRTCASIVSFVSTLHSMASSAFMFAISSTTSPDCAL